MGPPAHPGSHAPHQAAWGVCVAARRAPRCGAGQPLGCDPGRQQADHRDVKTTLTVYAHLINTDDHTCNMAALGALGNPISSENVIPIAKARR